MAKSPYGNQTGGDTVAYGGQRGSNAAHAREILSRAGYNVRLHGPWTPRLHNAWQHYLNKTRTVGGLSAQQAAKRWNKTSLGRQLDDTHRPAGGAVSSMHGGAFRGSGGPSKEFVKEHGNYDPGKRPKGTIHGPKTPDRPNPTVNAHDHAKTKVKARVHAENLGAKGHGVGAGAGVPGTDTGTLLPRSMADQLAGLQFDPAIREAREQQLRQGRDEAQAQADIRHWGDIVSGSQATAGQRDIESGKRVSADVQGAITGIQNLLGGSRGAGVVGAAGVNDMAALGAEREAQEQYNADVAPILRTQQADQAARRRALASQEANKLSSELVNLQGQRGQAKQKAIMDIIAANNAARQQNFGNRLALQNAELAAQSLGLKSAQVAASLKAAGLDYELGKAKLDQVKEEAKAASGHPNWAAYNSIDRRKLADQAVADAVGTLPPGVWDEEAIWNQALHNLRSGGFKSARRLGHKVPSRINQVSIIGNVQSAIARARQKQQAGAAA